MSLWKWSRTASSNATADSTVNMREGMSPSAVNDSARAMMAALAKYRDDVAGMITTAGTSSAYTVTSYQTLTTATDGFTIAFVPHVTNAAGATLSVDGLTARALRLETGVSLPASTLIAGTPYTATYDSDNTEWLLHGYYSAPSNLPLGSIVPYAASTAPTSNFVLCYGQAVSRTTYASLFSLVSTTYGVGDGSTTFNVPDLRGRSIFGVDAMGGSGASRIGTIVGATIGSAGGTETHTLTEAQLPAHTHVASVTDPGHTHTYNEAQYTVSSTNNATSVATSNSSANTGSATTGITVSNANTGSGSAHSNMPPAIVLAYIMRVL